MNRVISTIITIATAATATIAVAAAITPAMAAQHPAHSRPAKHAKLTARDKTGVRGAKLSVTLPDKITSEFGGGKYVTIVQCHGTAPTPAPVRIARPDVPLLVHGGVLKAKIIKLLAKPHTYKTVYRCTVVVKAKVLVVVKKVKKTTHKKSCEFGRSGGAGGKGSGCSRIVTLNTGFGGAAGRVAGHHPAG